jgi:uncharacterized protein YhfF
MPSDKAFDDMRRSIKTIMSVHFGDSPNMTTELADLVMAGIKRAIASFARNYGEGREQVPKPGDFVRC